MGVGAGGYKCAIEVNHEGVCGYLYRGDMCVGSVPVPMR